MRYAAKFEKVSFEQFKKDYIKTFLDVSTDFEASYDLVKDILSIYDKITLPERATKGSAGYDFISPIDFMLEQGQSIKIPTGIRVKMDDDFVLMCFPRSSLGFKYRLWCDNLVGIIDSDYYDSDNEGHIFLKLTNNSLENKTIDIKQGEKITQGIFVPFGITVDDIVDVIRNGGMGSTDEE